jgi:broad specificity phosphatase PhoE
MQGVILGQLDSPLASEAVPPLNLAVASVLASPLLRARRTAELLFPNQPIFTLPDLREACAGEWEGLSWKQICGRWPELAQRKEVDWYCEAAPGGEDWITFTERVQRALVSIRLVPAPVAVVAHAGVNAVLAHLISGLSPHAFQQQYCEILTYELPD